MDSEKRDAVIESIEAAIASIRNDICREEDAESNEKRASAIFVLCSAYTLIAGK